MCLSGRRVDLNDTLKRGKVGGRGRWLSSKRSTPFLALLLRILLYLCILYRFYLILRVARRLGAAHSHSVMGTLAAPPLGSVSRRGGGGGFGGGRVAPCVGAMRWFQWHDLYPNGNKKAHQTCAISDRLPLLGLHRRDPSHGRLRSGCGVLVWDPQPGSIVWVYPVGLWYGLLWRRMDGYLYPYLYPPKVTTLVVIPAP